MSIFNLGELIEDYAIITLHGKMEMYIQNYISIFELIPERIKIKTIKEMLIIEGTDLKVEFMDSTGIKIIGIITKLELL